MPRFMLETERKMSRCKKGREGGGGKEEQR